MLKLFEALQIFDWVTPAKGLVEDVINDPTLLQSNSWTFFIPYEAAIEAGHNARGIEKLLDKQEIHHWGSQITGGEFFFSVPIKQAAWAEYHLSMAGIPIGLGTGAPCVKDDDPQLPPPSSFSNNAHFPNLIIVEHPSIWRAIGKAIVKLF